MRPRTSAFADFDSNVLQGPEGFLAIATKKQKAESEQSGPWRDVNRVSTTMPRRIFCEGFAFDHGATHRLVRFHGWNV